MHSLITIYSTFLLFTNCVSKNFKLTIIHTNDLHSNFDETHVDNKSYGGIGRVSTYIEEQRSAPMGEDEGLIYLDAGDMFTGTDWFAFNRTQIASDFMSLLHPDAVCLGNHEFDLGLDSLREYINKIKQPLLCSNVDISREPSFKGKIIPSKILTVKGWRIGIVAYLHRTSRSTDRFWGKMTIESESVPIKREIDKFKNAGIKIIILLTHGGYKRDIQIAKKSVNIDVIVDGHSHTFFYSGNDRKVINGNKVSAPYPLVVKNKNGKDVYIVQAFCNAEYVGKLIATFDSDGEIIETEGAPQFMDESIKYSRKAKEILDRYRPFVEMKRNEIVGKSQVELKGGRPCRRVECNLGNLILDAYVYHASKHCMHKKYWTNTSIAIMNSGNIRQGIVPHWRTHVITFAQIMAVLPFFNILVTMTVTGKVLLLSLEHSISWKTESHKGEFLQMSGLRVVYDYGRPSGKRVVSVRVRCANCEIPKYEPLDEKREYNIITTDFLSGGGSGFKMFKNQPNDKGVDQAMDIDTFKEFLAQHSVVDPEVEERFVVLHDNRPDMDEDKADKILSVNYFLVFILIFFSTIIL